MSDAPNGRSISQISQRKRKSLNDVLTQAGRISQRLYHGESGAQSTQRMLRVKNISDRYIGNILRRNGNSATNLYDYIMNGNGHELQSRAANRRFGRSTYAQ